MRASPVDDAAPGSWRAERLREPPGARADLLTAAAPGVAGIVMSAWIAATCESVRRYSRPHRLWAYPLRFIIQRSAQADTPGK
jgi:hypothetical protein